VSLGQQAGAGDRSGSDRCANQECATSFIVFGHAFLPLLHKTSSASFRRRPGEPRRDKVQKPDSRQRLRYPTMPPPPRAPLRRAAQDFIGTI
jgi:hypothetical protein